jgi:hypothetical protein
MPIYETPGYVKTSSVEITVDTNTASTSYVDLLTVNITTSTNEVVLCEFGSVSLNATGQTLYRLTVDGTTYQSAATRLGAGATTICPLTLIDRITGLSAGDHVIKIQWEVTAGTAYIRPVAQVGYEFASLIITQMVPLAIVPVAAGLVQTIEANITVDTTTNSTSFGDLFSQSITTTGGSLIIFFNANSSNSNTNNSHYFQITVDAVVHEAGACRYVNTPAVNINLIDKVGNLSTGAHTVKVQWRTSANQARIRPVTAAGSESAQLTILEVMN